MSASAGAIRAGRAFVELFTEDSALKKGLDGAAARVKAFGAGIAAAGAKIAAAGAIISAPFVGAAKGFASAAGDLDRLSKITGVSASALSELSMAAGGLDNLQLAFKGLGKTLYQAQTGSTGAAEALGNIGLSADQLTKLSMEDRLVAVADAISKVADQGTRTGIALEIFGRGALDLMPLLGRGAAGIKTFRDRAKEFGVALSDDQIKSGVALKRAYGALEGTTKGIWNAIGAAVAPVLTELLGMATKVVQQIGIWVRQNKELIVSFFKWGLGISLVGGALVSLGGAVAVAAVPLSGLAAIFGLIGTAVGAAVGLIGAILTPVGLVVAAVAALGGGLLYASGVGGQALGALKGWFGELKETALLSWDGIKDALAKGDLGLAAEIAWAGIKVAFLSGTESIRVYWAGLWADITDGWKSFMAQAEKVINFTKELFKGLYETIKSWAQAAAESGWWKEFSKFLRSRTPWGATPEPKKPLTPQQQEKADARDKAQQEARDALGKAQEELNKLRNKARPVPSPQNFGPGADGPVRRPPPRGIGGGAAVGTFSAQVAQQLGIGKTFGEEQKKTNQKLDKVNEKLDMVNQSVRDGAPQYA